MKLIISKPSLFGAPTEVSMEHGDEKLDWNITLFDKIKPNSEFDIFEQINNYWHRLPNEDQSKIFNVYKKIKAVFDLVYDTNELTRQLYSLIAELYEYHNIADIRHWVDFYSNIVLPTGLRDAFKEANKLPAPVIDEFSPLPMVPDEDIQAAPIPGTPERTYLKEDYKWLLSLSVALRIMIPIWGEYIARTKKETGTLYKEYYAYQLLAYSSIDKSEPMERLKVYVEHSIPSDKLMSSAIFGGVSTEDQPSWILAQVLIRRLAIEDIRGINTNLSLVTTIYKYIIQKIKGFDTNFIGQVKDKINDSQNQDGENNLSKLEGYKAKQEVPAGDIAIISHYLSNIDNLALQICPDINLDFVRDSVRNAQSLEIGQLWKPQVIMVQWVLKKVVSPKGIMHINKNLTIKLLGLTQALLIHRGHLELGGLVTAIEESNKDELLLGGTDSRARITKDQLEQLDRLFPYSRKPTGKQKVVKRINPAVEAIDSVASLFSEHDWKLTLPNDYVEKITGNSTNRRYATPYNIKILLANLAISLASRTF